MSAVYVQYAVRIWVNLRLGIESSLKADAWALRMISEYQGGKVLLWSWVSRGLTSLDQVAKWHFDSNVEEAELALHSTRGKMAELCALDEVPTTDFPEEKQQVVLAEESNLEGEIRQLWAIVDAESEGADPIPLPAWCGLAIDKAILLWRREYELWNGRFAKRLRDTGKDYLPPAQMQKYEDWCKEATRSIVLDKKKKAQVVNVADKSLNQLRKSCILLKIQMSNKAEDLMIQAGSGKQWKLRLFEGSVPHAISDQVPPEVDHFRGLSHARCCDEFNHEG